MCLSFILSSLLSLIHALHLLLLFISCLACLSPRAKNTSILSHKWSLAISLENFLACLLLWGVWFLLSVLFNLSLLDILSPNCQGNLDMFMIMLSCSDILHKFVVLFLSSCFIHEQLGKGWSTFLSYERSPSIPQALYLLPSVIHPISMRHFTL